MASRYTILEADGAGKGEKEVEVQNGENPEIQADDLSHPMSLAEESRYSHALRQFSDYYRDKYHEVI